MKFFSSFLVLALAVAARSQDIDLTEREPATSTVSAAAATCDNRTKFKYFGVNQAGAEFGNTVWPGALGKEYIFPAPR